MLKKALILLLVMVLVVSFSGFILAETPGNSENTEVDFNECDDEDVTEIELSNDTASEAADNPIRVAGM